MKLTMQSLPFTKASVRTTLTLILALSLLSPLSGCGTVNSVSTRGTTASTSIPYTQQINDALSGLFLKAKDVRLVRTPGDVLKAQVDIANDGLATRHFSYKFDWLDQDGTTIDSKLSTWQQKEIAAGGMDTITAVAPIPQATDFRLQVRRAN